MEINKREVGNRIRDIRTRKGLTMAEFGKVIDKESPASDSIVSRWERGVSLPSNDRLPKIAEFGGMSVDELLYGSINERVITVYDSKFDDNYLNKNAKSTIINNTINILSKVNESSSITNDLISETIDIENAEYIMKNPNIIEIEWVDNSTSSTETIGTVLEKTIITVEKTKEFVIRNNKLTLEKSFLNNAIEYFDELLDKLNKELDRYKKHIDSE